MIDRSAWTGLIKVYQVLEKAPSKTDCISESNYTVLTLEHLLFVNNHENLRTLLQSTTTPQLFMMSCDINQLLDVENKQIFETLFNSLKKNQSVKIILITQTENDTTTIS